MITINEIRNQLASYLVGETPFEPFEDWLITNSWNMHLDSSQDAQELIHEINASIYEYLDGYIDEARLERQLSPFVEGYRASLIFATSAPPPPTYQPSSSSPAEPPHRIAFAL
jgi:hypothetical protein